jgi:antitoxin HicB
MPKTLKKKHSYVGSSLDDFLTRECILEKAEKVAAKCVFVFQLQQEMKKQKIDKTELAQRLETSRSAIDRILDPAISSTLKTLVRTARVIGRKVRISII